MNIKHHPDNATIMAYAAGTLDEAFAVLVSCHLEVCSHCTDKLDTAEEIGGAGLETLEEAPLEDGSLGRILEKISATENGNSANFDHHSLSRGKPTINAWEDKPIALANYLEPDLANVKWRRAGIGAWQKPIRLSPGAKSSLRLLKIASGRAIPEHSHGGQELTLILCGAYKDEIGMFAAGDVADLDESIHHKPMVVSDGPCICLAATEAKTRFSGLIGRIMQPIVGV